MRSMGTRNMGGLPAAPRRTLTREIKNIDEACTLHPSPLLTAPGARQSLWRHDERLDGRILDGGTKGIRQFGYLYGERSGGRTELA